MTQLEFDNYKLQIQYIMSKKASTLANYLAIGKAGLNNDKVNLDLLGTYMDIMESYDLEEYDSEDPDNENTINFFTRDEMQSIVTIINKICSTHYNIDFIKTD